MPTSVLEKFRQATAKQAERKREPWLSTLEHVAGQVDRAGVERISTGHVLDLLRIPMARRTPQLFIRLSAVMRQLGWTPCRMRDFNAGGYKEQLRGFCRQAERKPLRGADAQSRSRPPADPNRALGSEQAIPSSGLKQGGPEVS
jgi:hypothetical protein